jgi:hypothetical protein
MLTAKEVIAKVGMSHLPRDYASTGLLSALMNLPYALMSYLGFVEPVRWQRQRLICSLIEGNSLQLLNLNILLKLATH